jgi:hypothetical protein
MHELRGSTATEDSHMRALLLIIPLVFAALQPASAQPASEVIARHMEAGTINAGAETLQRMVAANPSDANAVQALGFMQMAQAVETLGQGLYRYGLVTPRGMLIPILRLPVPNNPAPEKLDYAKLRAVYVRFLADLAKAEATLARVPASGDIKFVLNLGNIKLDLKGGSRAEELEPFGKILIALGMRGEMTSWKVAFDRADGTWLRGYTHVLSSFLEFVLAYDWQDTYGATAHHFFMGARDADNPLHRMDSGHPSISRDSPALVDAVALIHLVRWPLAEPERMKRAHGHLKQVVALSRQTWREVMAETDDDREWLPNPRQKSRAVTIGEVTDARVTAWLQVMDEFDALLDGRKLLAHWRFNNGIDMKAFFEQPRAFDLVLWATGHGATPYLKEGPLVSSETTRQWQMLFGGQFFTYAFWFN